MLNWVQRYNIFLIYANFRDEKWEILSKKIKNDSKKPHICKYMPDHNFVQISTKMRISSLRNRNLVQISTKMRIKFEHILPQKTESAQKVNFFAFFVQKIWSCRKKAVPLHRSPGNSSPRYDAGDESGFFIFMAKSELEILTEAFSAQRLSKYVAYNHGDPEKTVMQECVCTM